MYSSVTVLSADEESRSSQEISLGRDVTEANDCVIEEERVKSFISPGLKIPKLSSSSSEFLCKIYNVTVCFRCNYKPNYLAVTRGYHIRCVIVISDAAGILFLLLHRNLLIVTQSWLIVTCCVPILWLTGWGTFGF